MLNKIQLRCQVLIGKRKDVHGGTQNRSNYPMTTNLPPTSRSLPFALLRAREGVMAPIRDMLNDTGITEQQWRVLRVLSEYGPQDTSTLADRASLLFPSLTRIVQKMLSKDLITQTRDKEDRRRQIIAITPSGQKIIDDTSAQGAQLVSSFKSTLGEDQFEQLLDLLALLDPHNKS